MDDGTKWIMREGGVDVERPLIRSEGHGHLAIQPAISSWTAHDMESRPIADDVRVPMNWIVARGHPCR